MARTREPRGIVEVSLHDFSGGFTPRLASTEFTERQWATLKGVVLETAAVVRSQWSCQKIGAELGFKQVGSIAQWLIGLKDDGTVWYTDYPVSTMVAADTRAKTWTMIPTTTIPADSTRRILCQIPSSTLVSGKVVQALLLNTADDSKSAYALYDETAATGPDVKVWTKRFPDTAGESDVMPAANVGAMWADFLVLGDIMWSGTGGVPPFRHEAAVWFSEPGAVDKWDAVNVVRTTVDTPFEQAVYGLIPIDAGLLIFTGTGVTLLRGLANDHSFEELRKGLAVRDPQSPCYWAVTGGAVWVTKPGEIWATNGETFSRLDDHLFLADAAGFTGSGFHDGVRPFGQHLLAARKGRLLCFSIFDGEGAWTELITPGNAEVRAMHIAEQGNQLYFVNGADGTIWRYNNQDSINERGLMDGSPITATISTRTVEAEAGHGVTMWHRFGFRSEGPGTIVDARVAAGPALASGIPGITYALNRPAAQRDKQMVPSPGPSVEASATVRFQGDVSIEQVSFWHHRGRGHR